MRVKKFSQKKKRKKDKIFSVRQKKKKKKYLILAKKGREYRHIIYMPTAYVQEKGRWYNSFSLYINKGRSWYLVKRKMILMVPKIFQKILRSYKIYLRYYWFWNKFTIINNPDLTKSSTLISSKLCYFFL